MNDAIEQFKTALVNRGIIIPAEIIGDGLVHRADVEGPGGKNDAAYKLYLDDRPAGWIENHKDGMGLVNWKAGTDAQIIPMTPLQRTEMAVKQVQRDAEQVQRQAEASQAAADRLDKSEPATDHPYLTRKGIKANGARLEGLNLLIPMRDTTGKVHSLQSIAPDGDKRFLSGGRVPGCYFSIGKPDGLLIVCEGFATGASLYESTGHAVAIAFNAGNLDLVATALHKKYPELKILIAADDDHLTEGNPGMTKATAAALAVGGSIAVPVFPGDRPTKATDFNDLHQLAGIEAVRACIEAALVVKVLPAAMVSDTGWPDPEPLIRSAVACPYPVDSLPEIIRLAVEEVQGFTMAPAAMVACSALANLSLVAQAHHDVQRAEKLSGPTGLYFLVIAESGERKSTCDGLFSKVLRDYESQQQEEAKPAIQEFKADFSAWEATKSGILDAIKQEAKQHKSGVDAGQLEHTLRKHHEMEPEPPRVPRLIYSDFTPEALTYSLSKVWPSGGVISSEAGAVFGSHGMSGDSQMRTLSNLNQLWEAARLTFDRRSAGGSYVVDGARLTMALQVQESALLEFFKRTGTLARGTGFLARFLMAHPESTQGTRLYKEPPENTPALAAYYAQLHRILQVPVPINENGGLEPSMLALTPDAKNAWIRFHDEVEMGLGKGGELQEVRDVASKIADNAVRLAALFHVIDGGIGAISVEHFESAGCIAAWHLNEALRFFGELALPEAEADAVVLDEWLIEYCTVNRTDVVSTRAVARLGPYRLRTKGRMDAAVLELIDRNRIVVIQSGKKREIQINPQLLGENNGVS